MLKVVLPEGANQLNTASRIGWELSSDWWFRELGSSEWLKASVPGCNFLDLMASGGIPDPFYRDNEKAVQWLEQRDWEYKTVFSVDESLLRSKRIDLVFEGLDTFGEVYLNGRHVLSSENMFRGYRCEVGQHLIAGENELRIVFESPIKRTEHLEQENGFSYPAENDHCDQKLSVFCRKAPYHFGWDWGPRLVSSGIWKPIILEAYENARIAQVRHRVDRLDSDISEVSFLIQLDATQHEDVEVRLACAEVGVAAPCLPFTLGEGVNNLTLTATINKPELWWPNGLGAQRLYEFEVELVAGGQVVSRHPIRIGLRTIELINEPDADGEAFYFKVNGAPVFMKGANYIPSDTFLTRMNAERYEEIFRNCAQANMNMLRVWGGGIYEDDQFYDFADEYGILIWQDFMFACSLYPSTPDFLDNVEEEVRQQVQRLRHHPSLALWCGNNEIELGIVGWNWPETFSYSDELYERLKADYRELFQRLIPQWLSEEDPYHAYLASSPIGNWEDEADDKRGDAHYWGVWHGGEPFSEYERRVPRFMSEYGFQSFPIMASVEDYTLPEDRIMWSDVLRQHQKHPRGNRLIASYMKDEYDDPQDFDSLLYLSQVQQAAGLKKAFVAHRTARPFCMGSLFWQLNDCWPVASWSCIDYYGRKKALFYEAARCFEPLAVFCRLDRDAVIVDVVNDNLQPADVGLQIELVSTDGTVLWREDSSLTIAEGAASRVRTVPLAELPEREERSRHVFRAQLLLDGAVVHSDIMLFQPIKDLKASKPNVEIEHLVSKEEGVELSIKTDCFAPSVFVSPPKALGAVNLSDNFFSLMPGERRLLTLKADAEEALLSPEAWRACTVFSARDD